MSEEDHEWVQCQLIRIITPFHCVIRVEKSGVILPIRTVGAALPLEYVPLVHPLRPVQARVRLGVFDKEGFTGCTLEAEWDLRGCGYWPPPPSRHQKKRKTVDDTKNVCSSTDIQGAVHKGVQKHGSEETDSHSQEKRHNKAPVPDSGSFISDHGEFRDWSSRKSIP